VVAGLAARFTRAFWGVSISFFKKNVFLPSVCFVYRTGVQRWTPFGVAVRIMRTHSGVSQFLDDTWPDCDLDRLHAV